MPSRNRTVLAGLVRDTANPLATRFEVRAPNPHTNTYLAVAAFCQSMLDGMAWAASSGRSARELQEDFSKPAGAAHPYLEKDRAYRSEEDVFEHFDAAERDRLFGRPPATVWETFAGLDRHPDKVRALQADGVFSPEVVASYRAATLLRWATELTDRVIPENARIVHACVRLPGREPARRRPVDDDPGAQGRAGAGRREPHVDLHPHPRGRGGGGLSRRSPALQLEMAERVSELTALYRLYRQEHPAVVNG